MDFGKIKETVRLWFHSRVVRQFALSSFWMMAARAAWIVSAFTVGVVTARHLGPHDFGVVSYVVAYVGMFAVIANLGIDSVIARDYVQHPEKSARIMGNFFAFKLLTTLVMLLAVAVSLCFMSSRETVIFCLIVSSGYLFYPLKTVEVVFQAKVKNEYLAYSELLTCFLYSAFRLWAVLTRQPLLFFVIAEAFLTGGIAFFSFLFYGWKIGDLWQWRFSWKEAAALIIPALPLAITVILSGIYAKTDILMLQHYLGAATVGHYTIAVRFTENMAIVFAMLANIFAVVVIQANGVSREAYEKQLHRFYFMMFYLTLPPIALSWLLGRPVIHFLYGEAFLPSVEIFYVYVLTLATNSLLLVFCRHAVNGNRLKTIAAVYGSGVVLNVPLNMLLIPHWGGRGAAAASFVSMAAGLVLVLLVSGEGRADLRFMVKSLTRFPSLALNDAVPEKKVQN